MGMVGRHRDQERQLLLQRGLTFACQENQNVVEVYPNNNGYVRDNQEGGVQSEELFTLLRELGGLQVRLSSLMDKMGSLPIDLIRDMRLEIVEVTHQLRNINSSHHRP